MIGVAVRKKFAIIFPGQGSQHVGLLSGLAKQYPIVKATFDEASTVLGYDLWRLAQEGPAAQLDQTEFTQPTLLAADVACFRCWIASGGSMPDFMAGHSLGEYAALVCAESLAYEQAIELVAKRGRYMQEAVPEGQGAMGAIIGLGSDEIQSLCEQVSFEQGGPVSPANFNSIGQTVIAGQMEAVETALQEAKARGAKLAKRIPVSVPAHCSLMQPAADRLTQDLAGINIKPTRAPILHNTDVSFHEADTISSVLVAQLVNPVRWVETIRFLVEQDVVLFLESGPDNKLAGLNKRITERATTLSLSTPESIAAAMNEVEQRSGNEITNR
jgi:[acyl-carrier-protein] S-malonyltransferase